MKIVFFMREALAFIVLVLLTANCSYGQNLKNGDSLPDLEWSNLVNHSTQKLKLSTLNKKLVILQFWNTKCAASLKYMKAVDSLQKRFSKDLQFVLVSKESPEELESFFKSHRNVVRPNVPMIGGDKEFKKYFEFQYVPHHVWLENGTKIFARVSAYNSSAENIASYLEGNKIELQQISNAVIAQFEKPLIQFQTDTGRALFFSYLIPAVDSISGAVGRQRILGSKTFNRIYYNKASAIDLYITAFNEGSQRFLRSLNNIELRLHDSLRYTRPSKTALFDEWQRKNLYLYDLAVHPNQAKHLYSIMQTELQRVFPLRAHIESRTAECFGLFLSDNGISPVSKGGKSSLSIRKKPADSLWIFQNIPFPVFFLRMQNILRNAGFEIVDATNLNANIDLVLDANSLEGCDFDALNKDLFKVGLVIKRTTCKRDILVIQEE